MAERHITDARGGPGYRINAYLSRSAPTTSPLSGRSVRTVLAQDTDGMFRVGTRTGQLGKAPFEMTFAREGYENRAEALRHGHENVTDFIRGEAETYLQQSGRDRNAESFRVDSIEGWPQKTQHHKSDPKIRKLVWSGPMLELDEAHGICGVAGETKEDKFLAGTAIVYREFGPGGQVRESPPFYDWQRKEYEHKEQAIFGARDVVSKEFERLSGERAPRQAQPTQKEGLTGFIGKLLKGVMRPQRSEPVRGRGRGIDR